jgi:hypothetical protein
MKIQAECFSQRAGEFLQSTRCMTQKTEFLARIAERTLHLYRNVNYLYGS